MDLNRAHARHSGLPAANQKTGPDALSQVGDHKLSGEFNAAFGRLDHETRVGDAQRPLEIPLGNAPGFLADKQLIAGIPGYDPVADTFGEAARHDRNQGRVTLQLRTAEANRHLLGRAIPFGAKFDQQIQILEGDQAGRAHEKRAGD